MSDIDTLHGPGGDLRRAAVNTRQKETRGRLARDRIPDPISHYAAQVLRLTPRGRQRMGECPVHGGSDSLSVDTATGRWLCFACGAKGGNMLDLHMQAHGLSLRDAARELGCWDEAGAPAVRIERPRPTPKPEPERQPVPDFVCELWGQRQPLAGSIGMDYLMARGCAIPPADGDLAFHPGLRHPTGYRGAALVARITDAVTREPMGLHRTWVTPTGKAEVQPAKMTLGPKQGGVIRLWPDEAVTAGLAVAEGIETSLSIAHTFKPVWCLIDAGNLATFPVLPGIECLVIGADHDPAGIKAARECADRWARAGRDVRVILPHEAGADWNDAEVAA